MLGCISATAHANCMPVKYRDTRVPFVQVDRILKAKGNVTIETLQCPAKLVGQQLWL
jgi:hypothetical protein